MNDELEGLRDAVEALTAQTDAMVERELRAGERQREWSDRAIALAKAGRWQEALDIHEEHCPHPSGLTWRDFQRLGQQERVMGRRANHFAHAREHAKRFGRNADAGGYAYAWGKCCALRDLSYYRTRCS